MKEEEEEEKREGGGRRNKEKQRRLSERDHSRCKPEDSSLNPQRSGLKKPGVVMREH